MQPLTIVNDLNLFLNSYNYSIRIKDLISYYYSYWKSNTNFLWLFLFLTLPFLPIADGISQDIKESVHYHNYSIKDGLPSNETYDVFQDSKGFLWIGTDNGVVKYDGNEFVTYTTQDGLTDNTVFLIQEDQKGRIWFMTYNRELCYFLNNEIVPYKWNDKLKLASADIFIGTTITSFNIDEYDNVELILVDLSSIKISRIGKTQLTLYDNEELRLIKDLDLKTSVNKALTSLKEFRNTHKGSNKYIISNTELGKVHFIISDSTIFIGSKLGLEWYDRKTLLKKREFFHTYIITGIDTDFENGIWLSTLNNGVIYIPNINISAFKISSSLNNNFRGIIPQKNKLTFSFGILNSSYVYDPILNTLEKYEYPILNSSIPNKTYQNGLKFESPIYLKGMLSSIMSLSKIDKNRTLYSCPKHGLIITDKEKVYPSTLTNFTFFPKKAVYHDYYNMKWIRNDFRNSFLLKSDSNINNRWVEKFNPKVIKIFKDSKNKIWLGTLSGLFTFNTTTEEVENSNHFHEFTKSRIQDIIESKDGTMFFATKAYGIFTLKDSVVTEINTSNGLLSNTINQLIYDSTNNQVWAGTNQGIARLTLQNGVWTPKSIITKNDGLELTDVRQLAFHNDDLFFANNSGVSKIKKSQLNHSSHPPILYIKSLQSNQVKKPIYKRISLTYDSNDVQIDYQAISFKSLNEFEYQYKLLPDDKTWQSTTNSNLIFNTLPPNDYTLILKAINVDGVESEPEVVRFTVNPAFWMTIWFKSIILLLLSYIGYRIIISSINFYKKQAENQKTLNELQILSLQSKMNPHFIFNSLNSIQNYILKNEKEEANNYLIEFSKLVRIILQNSDSATITLTNELDTLKMYVDLEIRRLRNNFKYTTNIDSSIDIEKCEIPSLLIQPYVENAIWHGKVYNNPDGEISLNVKKIDDLLIFEIIDNGIGIANAEKSKIIKSSHTSLGTSVNQKRIEILGDLNTELSKVVIKEAFPGKEPNDYVGTHVIFSIPYITSNKNTNE